jgi:L-asparaginase II
MCNFHIENIAIGIDGCSAPVFAIPLENAAFGYARLCDPVGLNSERAAACETITQSMIDQPEMVAGPGKFDTRIMEVLQGKIISKGGAEGFQQIGIMPGVLGKDSPGFGIALKISDGDALYKVRPAVILAVLDQLGVMTKDELEKLADFGPSVDLKNWRKMIVGQAHPTIHLSEILPPS